MRWRAVLAGTAVLVAGAPLVASAFTPPLTCRDVKTVDNWQRVPIQRFQPIEGVASNDTVTSYSLSATRPQLIAATNGKRLKVSTRSGCEWSDGLTLGLTPTSDVPLTGTTSTIVSTASLPTGRVLAAVREGSGAASRPHVVGSDNGRSDYRLHDSGLPPQGAPRFLEASDDGRTIYLVLTPTSSEGPGGGLPLPGVPDVNSPTSGAKTGLLYASTDEGRTWELRTTATDLPEGGGGLDRLAVDRQNADRLYAISNGLLLFSLDGGGSFSRVRVNNQDITAVETGPGGFVIAFTASGQALISNDGKSFVQRTSPPGVTSAAYRNSAEIAVESKGRLALLDLQTGRVTDVPRVPVTPGSLIGDVSSQATYHGLQGHSLLRYTDPKPPVGTKIDVALGDLGVSPPPPGTITPSNRRVQLKVGEAQVLDYSLALPKSPTPLDLMFVVDTSGSMDSLIEDLKRNISKTTGTIQRAGVDLQVGIAAIGTGSEAATPVPNFDPSNPTARASKLYELLRPIGRPDQEFADALEGIQTGSNASGGNEEAQLISLEQATAGRGVRDPRAPAGVELYLVPPGQDARWRQAPGIRRLIVHASDEAFAKPYGTRLKDGEPDVDGTVRLLNQFGVKQIGLSLGIEDARRDMAKVARGTRTFAPPGGADCGDEVVLPAGAPLVCDTAADFSAIIGRLVRALTDRQNVGLVAKGTAPKAVRNLDASRLAGVDVTVPNRLSFKVAVSCKGLSVGRYTEEIGATLRGSTVASTRLTVDCLGPAAAALLAPPVIPAGAAPPAAPPVAQAPAAVVPAPPAAQPQVQPQSQPQTQVQVNPLTAAAMQQQEELQLALALQADEKNQPGTEMAMVGSRRAEEPAALVLLAASMAACTGLGLARLRRRPDPAVARVRR